MQRYSILLVLWPALVMGCSESKESAPGSRDLIKIMGDPKTFISQTLQDPDLGLPLASVEEGQEFALNFISIGEQPQIDYESLEEIKQTDQAPPSEVADHKLTTYLWRQESGQAENGESYDWILSPKNDQGFYLYFQEISGRLHLVIIAAGNKDAHYPFTMDMEHYSVLDNDDQTFSLLASVESQTQPLTLVEFQFFKYQGKSLLERMVDRTYNYLLGPGVAVSWNRSPNILLCGFENQDVQQDAQESVARWEKVLKSRLELQFEIGRPCPPFSDLNAQGIYLLKDWQIVMQEQLTAPAFHKGFMNKEASSFIDGDIFVLEKEWKKHGGFPGFTPVRETLTKRKFRSAFSRTILHEVGHLLGLHHMFDPETPSIMSYESSIQSIQSYDRQAIHELYPLTDVSSVESDQEI